MTNEEAIHALDTLVEAYGIAIRALHAQKDSNLVEIDQVKPAKLDRSRWEGCEFCLSERQDQGPCVCACSSFNISNKQYATRFCPVCGKPLIEEAWAELERRIGGES